MPIKCSTCSYSVPNSSHSFPHIWQYFVFQSLLIYLLNFLDVKKYKYFWYFKHGIAYLCQIIMFICHLYTKLSTQLLVCQLFRDYRKTQLQMYLATVGSTTEFDHLGKGVVEIYILTFYKAYNFHNDKSTTATYILIFIF